MRAADEAEVGSLAIRVAGPPGEPAGFCLVRGEELYQLFVSESARGSGIAPPC